MNIKHHYGSNSRLNGQIGDIYSAIVMIKWMTTSYIGHQMIENVTGKSITGYDNTKNIV